MGEDTTIDHVPDGDAPAGPQSERVALVVYARDGATLVDIPEGGSVVLGRAPSCDVMVDDPSLSRQHARFSMRQGEVWVEDLGSRNGTLVDGRPIDNAKLPPGSDAAVGSLTVSIHRAAASQALLHGFESHDRLLQRLHEEIERAQVFGRQLALLMVRATGGQRAHVSRWGHRLAPVLRPVDRLAIYGDRAVLALLPEMGEAEARRVAQKLVEQVASGKVSCGVACYPAAAASAEALLSAAHDATRTTDESRPVVVAEASQRARTIDDTEGPVVAHQAMRALYKLAKRAAVTDVPVLIIGETGTGKELVTEAIHQASGRSGALKVINCGAIPQTLTESVLFGHERGAFTGADKRAVGAFEQANGGTVFLDEVGELSEAAQVALLRVLETKRVTRIGSDREIEVDVRIVAATHRPLDQMVRERRFREDLLYRLNALTLKVPPLRERVEEVEPLAKRFLREIARAWAIAVSEIDPEALELMRAYRWPGNVRQLRNTIERALIVCQGNTITADDLPEDVRRSLGSQSARPPSVEVGPIAAGGSPKPSLRPMRDRVREFEVELILDALERAAWNRTKAAEFLQIPRRTLTDKMKHYGIAQRDAGDQG